MMIAIVVIAILLVAAKKVIGRPYPTWWFSSAAYYVAWSDRTMTTVDHGERNLDIRSYRLATFVSWPDGSFGVYLHPRAASPTN